MSLVTVDASPRSATPREGTTSLSLRGSVFIALMLGATACQQSVGDSSRVQQVENGLLPAHKRVVVTLASLKKAWMYVDARATGTRATGS